MAVLTLPDVAAGVRADLASVLAVPVVVGVPAPRPVSFVSVETSAGGTRNLVQVDETVLVQGWASTLLAAHALTVLAWERLNVSAQTTLGAAWVGDVSLTTPVNVDDPVSGARRYQFLVTFIVNLKENPIPDSWRFTGYGG